MFNVTCENQKAADAEEEMEKLDVKENEHSVIKLRQSS